MFNDLDSLRYVKHAFIDKGDILFFPLYIENEDKGIHPHIVLLKNDGILYTVSGQSDEASVDKQVKYNGKEYNCFPILIPNEENGLNRTTYFDCYLLHTIDEDEVKKFIKEKENVTIAGKANLDIFTQIIDALKEIGIVEQIILDEIISQNNI